MKKNKFLILMFIIILPLVLTSCKDKPNYITQRFPYFGYLDTTSSIVVQYDTNKISKNKMKNNMQHIDQILLDIEKTFSAKKTINMGFNNVHKSLLMEVNENSGKKDEDGNLIYTQVNQEFINLLKMSIDIAKLVDGSFDVTIGPLTSLWDISGQVGETPDTWHIPTFEEIQSKLKLVDYKNILIDETNLKVALPNEKMSIDFGAIAKGYAADKVLEYMKSLDITICLIDLGGNIYSYGESPITKTSISVRNPFYDGIDESVPYQVMKADINNISAVTSGTYERYIIVDGITYHHLLNPKTGYPFDNNLVSVSIFGDSSAMCDGLATGIYGLGIEAGIKTIKSLENYSAVFITNEKEVYIVGDITFVPESGTADFNFIYE